MTPVTLRGQLVAPTIVRTQCGSLPASEEIIDSAIANHPKDFDRLCL